MVTNNRFSPEYDPPIGWITVSAAWMKACGHPEAPKTYAILREIKNPFRADGPFAVMYEVEADDGHKWTVACGRGFLSDEFGNPLTKEVQA